MLEIVTADGNLELPDDIGIPLKITNPLFKDAGSHSLSFDLPLSDINKKLLGNPQRTSAKDTVTSIQVKVKFYGVTRFVGSINVLKVSKTISAYLALNEADYYQQAKDTSLKDLNLGDDIKMGEEGPDVVATMKLFADKAFGDDVSGQTVVVNFPMVKNDDFYAENKTKNPDYLGFINNYDVDTQEYPYNTIYEAANQDNKYAVSAFLYLIHIFNTIANHFNLQRSGSFWNNPEILKTLLYNNYDQSRKAKKYYLMATSTAPQTVQSYGGLWDVLSFTNDSVAPNEDEDGTWDGAKYTVQHKGHHRVKWTLNVTNEEDHNGFFRAMFLIDGTGSALGYIEQVIPAYETVVIEFEGTAWMDNVNVGDKLVVAAQSYFLEVPAHVFTVEMNSVVVINNDSWTNLNRLSQDIVLNTCVPDKNVNDFVKSVLGMLGFEMFINAAGNTWRIESLKNIISSSTINDITSKVDSFREIEIKEILLALRPDYGNDQLNDDNFLELDIYNDLGEIESHDDLPVIQRANDIIYIQNLDQYWLTYFNTDTFLLAWKRLTDVAIDISAGSGDLSENKPECSPMLMSQEDTFMCPAIRIQATSPAFDMGKTDCDLKLMIYHGWQKDKNSLDYPLASSQNMDHDGVIIGDLALKADGAYGLLEKNFGNYFQAMSGIRKPYQVKAVFTLSELAAMNLFEKFRINSDIGRIAEISTVIRKNKIEICEVEFWPE